jgi:hypothetical protein
MSLPAGELVERIEQSRAFTADATRSALAAVGALGASIRTHAEDLSVLAALARGAGRHEAGAGVTSAVEGMVQCTRVLSGRVHSMATEQHQAAARGAQALESIAALAREVDVVTADARLLGVNANIAATRLGHLGTAAAVIATRVQGFAAEMATEGRELTQLTREIVAVLPAITARSAGLLEESQALSQQTSERLAEIEGAHGAVGSELSSGVSDCERNAAAALSRVHSVETALRAHLSVEELLGDAADAAAAGDEADAARALERASRSSLAAVVPISDHLAALNDTAEAQRGALAHLAAGFRGSGSLGSASRALTQAIDGFVRTARATLAEQLTAAGAAVASEQRWRGTVDACRSLVMEARMLSLAVRVEAGRIGERGAEMVQIADQLAGFTARLDRVIAEIGVAMRTLRTQLEQLVPQSRSLSESVEAFAASAPRLGAALEAALSQATSEVERAVAASEERARALLGASHDLVGCLQFQDRLTQELRAIEDTLRAPSRAVPTKTFLETKREEGGLGAGELALF